MIDLIPQATSTVYVVDDDPAIIRLVEELVSPFGLAAASWTSAERFLEECRPTGPGCLVLDVTMPGMSGLALQRKLPEVGITLPVIMITAHGDVRMAVEAMRGGACQFLEKPLRLSELWESIQEAIRRDEANWRSRRQRERNCEALDRLSAAERQVFDRLVAGKTNKMIAEELELSVRTVEERRGKLMKKLGAESRAALVQLAAHAAESAPCDAPLGFTPLPAHCEA